MPLSYLHTYPPLTMMMTTQDRMREALKKERQEVIERLVKINPLYRPPVSKKSSSPPSLFQWWWSWCLTVQLSTLTFYNRRIMSSNVLVVSSTSPSESTPPITLLVSSLVSQSVDDHLTYLPIYLMRLTYTHIYLHTGPRGNTQKRMERESNTKIAIRGRGR